MREIAQNLSSVILKHEFSTQWLYKIWTINRLLRELGFDEALSPDDAKHCYRKKINENPMAAYEVLNGQYTTWLGTEGTERDADLDELCQYATDSIKRLKGVRGNSVHQSLSMGSLEKDWRTRCRQGLMSP